VALPTALVLQNLDLVTRLARKLRLTPRSSVWDDAIQAGNMGLVLAAERFDELQGTPFREYARAFVAGAIKDALKAEALVRPTRYALDRGASGLARLELDAVYEHHRVPAALVNTGVEDAAADTLDRKRQASDVRSTLSELGRPQRMAIEAVLAGKTLPQHARRARIAARTAVHHFSTGLQELIELFAESYPTDRPPDW
jgi:RNA polymerase sigma factor (sigma-70 family)